jgi:hypothetical protein
MPSKQSEAARRRWERADATKGGVAHRVRPKLGV